MNFISSTPGSEESSPSLVSFRKDMIILNYRTFVVPLTGLTTALWQRYFQRYFPAKSIGSELKGYGLGANI
jgi:hypothetical protein